MKIAHLILDRSGSMHGHWGDTIGAVNAYFASLAQSDPDTHVAVTVFDSKAVERVRHSPVTEYAPIDQFEVTPRGNTPLYDAIGRVIGDLRMVPMNTDDRRTIVVMTDGMENASTEWTRERVIALLDECKKDNWLVLFLGADPASFAQGQDLGLSRNNTIRYAAATPDNVMRSATRATQRYASAHTAAEGVANASFTEEERTSAASEAPTE